MGLHGSSTTPILLQDVKVPADNVLGEIGKGHKVALNTLNFGRFKLGAMCSGGAARRSAKPRSMRSSASSSAMPIADFGAIKHKLGEMTARTYALESLMYRTAGLIDATVAEGGQHGGSAIAWRRSRNSRSKRRSRRSSGSEVLDYVLDENVQIHGGNGFVKDYPAERYYRDARVNRIFEGTNEINRLLIPGMLIRRALKGEIGAHSGRQARCRMSCCRRPARRCRATRRLDADLRTVAAFKKVALMVLGTAMQTYGQKLTDEQEVLLRGGRHPDRYLCGGERGPARPGGGRRRPLRCAAARGGGADVRQRRHAAHPGGRDQRAGGDGRRRHAAHVARGAEAGVEGHAGQHRRAPPDARRRNGVARQLYC